MTCGEHYLIKPEIKTCDNTKAHNVAKCARVELVGELGQVVNQCRIQGGFTK